MAVRSAPIATSARFSLAFSSSARELFFISSKFSLVANFSGLRVFSNWLIRLSWSSSIDTITSSNLVLKDSD